MSDNDKPETEEMFPGTSSSTNRLQGLKKDILKAETRLTQLHKNRGALTRSLAMAKSKKDWTRIEDLKVDIREEGRKIKAKEEELCCMQKDLMYSFWPPRGLVYNKQSHLEEVRDRFKDDKRSRS